MLLHSPLCTFLSMITERQHTHLYGFEGTKPRSFIAYRIRRCTGLRPSCTSGSARPTITDMAYCTAQPLINRHVVFTTL